MSDFSKVFRTRAHAADAVVKIRILTETVVHSDRPCRTLCNEEFRRTFCEDMAQDSGQSQSAAHGGLGTSESEVSPSKSLFNVSCKKIESPNNGGIDTKYVSITRRNSGKHLAHIVGREELPQSRYRYKALITYK